MPVFVRGVEEIFRRLDQLPSIVADRVMGSALRAGGKIIGEEMKLTAHRQQTKDAIRINKSRASRSFLDIEYRVGPDNTDFIAMWEEYGTAARFHRTGKGTGQHPVRPFARPAFERSKGEAEDKILQVLDRGINNAVRRLNPGGK